MIQLLETTEARWFLADGDERLPALRSIFGGASQEATRCDWYAPTARVDLGIKARVEGGGARLETKFLVASLGPRRLGPSVEALLQRWKKVSVPCPSEELQGVQGSWLQVEKRRQFRSFPGCKVELTQLMRDRAWTLALEAFGGSGDGQVAILVATARSLFDDGWSTPLELERSESYPSWLSRSDDAG